MNNMGMEKRSGSVMNRYDHGETSEENLISGTQLS